MRLFRHLFLTACWVFGLAALHAQDAQQAAAPKISAISVRFVGSANVNEQVVRANMQLREGYELDAKLWAGLWMIEHHLDGRPRG